MNSAIDVSNTYPLDSNLSSGQQYPLLEQLGPLHTLYWFLAFIT